MFRKTLLIIVTELFLPINFYLCLILNLVKIFIHNSHNNKVIIMIYPTYLHWFFVMKWLKKVLEMAKIRVQTALSRRSVIWNIDHSTYGIRQRALAEYVMSGTDNAVKFLMHLIAMTSVPVSYHLVSYH